MVTVKCNPVRIRLGTGIPLALKCPTLKPNYDRDCWMLQPVRKKGEREGRMLLYCEKLVCRTGRSWTLLPYLLPFVLVFFMWRCFFFVCVCVVVFLHCKVSMNVMLFYYCLCCRSHVTFWAACRTCTVQNWCCYCYSQEVCSFS